MKILHVTPYFTPLRGGDVNVCYNLCKQLSKRGHEVTIVTTDFELDKEYAGGLEKIGAVIIPFHCVANVKLLLISPSMRSWVRSNVRNFDIIHMHAHRDFQNIVARHYARKYSIPYVLQAHGSVTTFFQKGVLKRIFDRVWGYAILRDAAKVIAATGVEAEQYKSMGVNEDKIEIVPNGIDLEEFSNLPPRGVFRRKYGLNDYQRVILYLGRIDKIKGLDLLANAFAGLSGDFNEAKLVIVGPGDGYLLALKRLIKQLKIEEKVLFTGPLYGQEKLQAYVDADVYVLPSSYEIFGITVLEACACGTPIIVTDRCGIANIIDSQAGLVVTYDKNQLQDAIQRVLSDDQLRQRLGNSGKLLVREKFNWEKIAEQVESIYLSCLESKS